MSAWNRPLEARNRELRLAVNNAMQVCLALPVASGHAARISKPVDLGALRREVAKACQRELIMPESPHALSGTAKPDPATVEVNLDADERQQLEHFLALGAVSDLMEWCQALANESACLPKIAVASRHAKLVGTILLAVFFAKFTVRSVWQARKERFLLRANIFAAQKIAKGPRELLVYIYMNCL